MTLMSLLRWLERIRRPGKQMDVPRLISKRVKELAGSALADSRALEAAARAATEETAKELRTRSKRLEELEFDEIAANLAMLGSSLHRRVDHDKVLIKLQQAPPAAATEDEVRQRLAQIAATPGEILMGPWTGDLASELLYWVPFLRWFVQRHKVDPSRLHIVGRSEAPWYHAIGGSYLDIASVVGAEAEAAESAAIPGFWFERRVLRQAIRRFDTAPAILHPGLMLRLLTPFWENKAALERVVQYLRPTRQYAVPPAIPRALPERFIAASFAFGPSFPDTRDNRMWLDVSVRALAQRAPVVWLEAESSVRRRETSCGYEPPAGIDRPLVDQAPDRRAGSQAAVVARATGCVTNQPGIACLAAAYGVKSVLFNADRERLPYARAIADHVFTPLKAPTIVNVADFNAMGAIFDLDLDFELEPVV